MKKLSGKFRFLALAAFFFAAITVLIVSNFAYAENGNPGGKTVIEDGYYQIEFSDVSSKVLGVSGKSLEENMERNKSIELQAPYNSESQIWRVSNDEQGNVKLINVNSGLFIAPAYNDINSGILATANDNHDGAGYWLPVASDDGFVLQYADTKLNTMFMDVNVNDNYKVNLTKNTNKWKFIKVEKPVMDMPSFNISLNGVTYDQICNPDDQVNKNKVGYKGNDLTIDDNNNIKSYNNVRVKGRGNSTWTDADKRAFGIKLHDKENLLGMGASKNWVLIANAFDTTNLHNDISFAMARMLDIPYAYNGKFVNLYIDNEYIGVYWLTHKIEISENAADLEEDSIIMCLDGHNETGYDDLYFIDGNINNLNPLCLKDYKLKNEKEITSEKEIDAQKQKLVDKFKEKWNVFTTALIDKDFNKLSEIMDVKSLASYFIISDIAFNSDAFRFSTNFYMTPSCNEIVTAPFWDFDLSFDVKNWWLDYELNPYSNFHTMFDSIELNNYLSQIPEFMDVVTKKYEIISKNKASILGNIDKSYNLYKKSFEKNDAKWRYFTNRAPKNIKPIDESMANFRDFLTKRLDYFDTLYLSRAHLNDGSYIINAIKGNNFKNGNYTLTNNADGSVKLFNETEQKYLRVFDYKSGATNSGVDYDKEFDSEYSAWYLCTVNSKYVLVSKHSGLVLDIDSTNGSMHIKNLDKTAGQLFTIEAAK